MLTVGNGLKAEKQYNHFSSKRTKRATQRRTIPWPSHCKVYNERYRKTRMPFREYRAKESCYSETISALNRSSPDRRAQPCRKTRKKNTACNGSSHVSWVGLGWVGSGRARSGRVRMTWSGPWDFDDTIFRPDPTREFSNNSWLHPTRPARLGIFPRRPTGLVKTLWQLYPYPCNPSRI